MKNSEIKVRYTNLVLELKGRIHWQDLIKSDNDILTFVDKLEQRTGLRFMARDENDTVNGFVTKLPEGYVISIYGVDKNPDEETPVSFKAVEVTKELERKIYGII